MTAAPVTLDTIKRDAAPLLAVLGLQRASNHGPCCFCGNRDAMSVSQSEAGWRFHCHHCAAAGSIVDAVALTDRITPAAAIQRLTGEAYRPTPCRPTAQTIAPPREPVPPVPDVERLRRVCERAQRTLYESTDLQSRWLGKRGIPLRTAQAYGVGFMPWLRCVGWQHPVKDCWVIPIMDAAGRALAVKLHREAPRHGPKCLWAPLGTDPKDHPRHGWATLWPAPESFWPADLYEERAAVFEHDAGLPRAEAEARARLDVGRALPWLYVCPGELKALAVIGAGLQATSITAGESHRWTSGLLSRLAGRRVCIVYDDDDAGQKFKNNTVAALCGVAVELKAVSFGQKEKA